MYPKPLILNVLHGAAGTIPDNEGRRLHQLLKKQLAQQLNGPHFETWLDPKCFDPTRLVMQARRLWYYSTLLAPFAMATQGYTGDEKQTEQGQMAGLSISEAGFSPKRMEQLKAAAVDAFSNLKAFRSGRFLTSVFLDAESLHSSIEAANTSLALGGQVSKQGRSTQGLPSLFPTSF
jgi:hypothetical protein